MALIDRVKYDGPSDTLVWKFPSEDLSTLTQVLVNESQEAVFYKEGKALDVLGPGRHTLSTGNIPLLEKLINLPFGGKTPFTAEVYYVSRATVTDLKWGTATPIQVQDPKYQLYVPVRSFGTYGIRVAHSQQFITSIVGTVPSYSTEDIAAYFRSVIMTRVGDFIAETIMKQNIPMVQIAAYVEEVSAVGKAKIAEDFKKYGIELTEFWVNSINIPEDDPGVQKLKAALADRAEMDILGDGYAQKRTFDTMEKAAENEGGGAGSTMGMGMGFGMGNQMGNMMSQAMNPKVHAKQSDSTLSGDTEAKIDRLQSLKEEGILTEEEFKTKVAELQQPQEDDVYVKIRKLAALKEEGILTEEEFQTKKQALLDQI
jgi:membrane protease subunit (stomatin/prohibitin family)